MDDLLAEFLAETNESLDELDTALVRLEAAPDDGRTLALIFRLVHTIKGTSGFIGLPRLERVAHAGENVLAGVRDKALPTTPDTVSTVLEALDRIRAIVTTLGATGREPPGDDSALIAALDAIAARPDHATPPRVVVASPANKSLADAAATPGGVPTIRVGVDVLDDLMTLVGELVLTRNQLLRLARPPEDQSDEMGAFAAPLQRLSRITSDLREGVTKTRMQRIGGAWNKLPRLARDMARDLDKTIELRTRGAETEIDRQVLELIRDPLTHIVRNCADHGIEAPAERRAAGKPETGHISLNAFHEGGHVIVELSDDGRGLAVDRIRAKVLANGLASEAEVAAMSDAQVQRYIFRAGFSTATEVTAISGRGVGMDVVKTNIERIGGTVALTSIAGQGTTFIIRIPLTLAIVSALIVAAGGERFAIPQISVIELSRARIGPDAGADATIDEIDGTPVLRLRERLVPLVRLDALLRLEPTDRGADDDGRTVVVALAGGTTFGIIVDRVFDIEEIVVKPVAPILRQITIFSGNTILGDGSVVMILDIAGVARAAGLDVGGDAREVADRAAIEPDSAPRRVAMLLFRAGRPNPMAVPLADVARLEELEASKIETCSGKPIARYRGRLMPLIPLSGVLDPGRPRHAVMVFDDVDGTRGPNRQVGLVVDEVVDVVEETLDIELRGARAGLIGAAVIDGHAHDVIDTDYWLDKAHEDWFRDMTAERGHAEPGHATRVLAIADSRVAPHGSTGYGH